MTTERSRHPHLFFSHMEKNEIIKAIQKAELQTSGEIRVHLQKQIKGEPIDTAKKVFEKIGMTNTKDRNGVLILLGVKNSRFVILGDSAINEKVPENFWDNEIMMMAGYFKKNQFAEGLIMAINQVGWKLKEFFPCQRKDINELPDEISYSK